ncbi:fatty acid desaturase [Sphingomonas sp. CFBP 8760]|uniref:fatty acid desaturase n=1 Tax=Sphingomonas sp. CFBP 8760 TaxID=2775282 RepID=UPI0018FEFCBD|nr:fatty acid desaturase [Sphingomonas sp. CFBP 8760]
MAQRTSRRDRASQPIEWPTVALAVVIYTAWLLLTLFHAPLPGPVVVVSGAWLIAWHGSFQHETIHGHPTRWHRVNALIGGVPLALWLPFACYRRDHIAHHATGHVTDPVQDPESRYTSRPVGRWGAIRLGVRAMQASLLGRLILGPAVVIGGFLAGEIRRAMVSPAAVLRDWSTHLAGVIVILAWVRLCGMKTGTYLLIIYAGTSLTLLRSFAEHRASPTPDHRVAVIENAGIFGILFLNNNLHAAHHRAPGLPWYALPRFYADNRIDLLDRNGGLLYDGYGEVFRRYAWRAHDVLVHPDHAN